MKTIRMIAAGAFIAVLASVSAFAQGGAANKSAGTQPTQPQNSAPANANVPTSKMAFIDTGAFSDEKEGISKFVSALKSLDREFKPRGDELDQLAKRIQAIQDEINKLANAGTVADPKVIQQKREEGEKLARDYKYKEEEYKATLQKRSGEVLGPIRQDIYTSLVAFAKQRGITTLVDVGTEQPLPFIMIDPNADITKAFIAEYNAKNPGTAASTTTPNRP